VARVNHTRIKVGDEVVLNHVRHRVITATTLTTDYDQWFEYELRPLQPTGEANSILATNIKGDVLLWTSQPLPAGVETAPDTFVHEGLTFERISYYEATYAGIDELGRQHSGTLFIYDYFDTASNTRAAVQQQDGGGWELYIGTKPDSIEVYAS
jgi:hypothetical protein